MIVYRYLTSRELTDIVNGDFNNLGTVYNTKKYKYRNTHKYQQGKRYLHFFKNKDACFKIKNFNNNNDEQYYICMFDIPFLILFNSRGYGYYPASGYDIDNVALKEYAIKVDDFKKDWLVGYQTMQNFEQEFIKKQEDLYEDLLK